MGGRLIGEHTARHRLESIDVVRGLAMILMALDHTRDYFANAALRIDLHDPSITGLFLTRWITNFCAPAFVLLAGTSAYLASTRGRSSGQTCWLLASRGAWLIALEFTAVYFAWHFNIRFDVLQLSVLWAIGCSMVVLAGLSFLPVKWIAALGVGIVAGHNALDGLVPQDFGRWGWLWQVLHVPFAKIGASPTLSVVYPVLPWVGVMASGYALGPVFQREFGERRKILWALGGAATIGFLILRSMNGYGDPSPWTKQSSPLPTILAFVDVTKYPPSLQFLLMTLGPSLLLLAALDGAAPRSLQPIAAFGRVPLFFYVTHLYLIHGAALVLAWIQTDDATWMLETFVKLRPPPAYGLGLIGVYLTWGGVVVCLYLPCRWFGGIKRRHRTVWLSYL